MCSDLNKIKQQKWFYEFDLPDGTKTECYLPEIARKIHVTREKALRQYLSEFESECSTALDVSCHEGYFSLILSQYFERVIGIDKNAESLRKAALIGRLLARSKIEFENTTIENWNQKQDADFVLCFGLLYHVENPIEILRKLALSTKKALCIETQVLPFQVYGQVEDGSSLWRRDLNGMFGLCVDYADRPEGGLTNLALVPSRDAIKFLLEFFGFKKVSFYTPNENDYEQFVRNHRVIVLAEK